MTSNFATLSANMTTREAIDALRREAPGKETIYRSCILDSEQRLIGSIRLHALILAVEDTRVEDIMERSPLSVSLQTDQEMVAQMIARYYVSLVFFMPLLIAMALGVTMAMLVFPVGLMRGGPEIALVVGMTMVIVVIVGSLAGVSLPFLLSRLRLDPATASAPLVTTLWDAVGVLVYFSIATLVLSP